MRAPLTEAVGCSNRAEYRIHKQEDLSKQTISHSSQFNSASLQTQSLKLHLTCLVILAGMLGSGNMHTVEVVIKKSSQPRAALDGHRQ